MPWTSAEVLFETVDEELRIWNRADIEGFTNRRREYVPRSERQPRPGNHNGRKTHCVNGHEFNNENTYVRPKGKGRECRACKRNREGSKT